MTSPTVTESTAALEPVSADPFLDGLGGTSRSQPAPAQAAAASRTFAPLTCCARLATVLIVVAIALGALGADATGAALSACPPAPALRASPPDPIPI